MQINNQYKGFMDCGRTIFAKEGLHAFYISYPTTLTMSIPFQMIQVTSYEYFRKLLNPNNEYNPLIHIAAGIV